MEKKLDVGPPSLTAYCYYGSLTSILSSARDFKKWLYSNFISLRFTKTGVLSYDHPISPTFFTPWTKSNCISRDMIRYKWESIIDFIIDSIDINNYVFLRVNRIHLKAFSGYSRLDSNHEMFIYGYNTESRILYIADNLKNGKYIFTTCSFDEFISSYNDISRDSYNGVIQVSLELDQTYDLDLTLIKYKLSEFLNPQDSIFMHNPLPFNSTLSNLIENKCGIEVYDQIHNIFNQMVDSGVRSRLDYRTFFLLCEHKSCMLSRIEYLRNSMNINVSDDTIMSFRSVSDSFSKILNLTLKYNMKNFSESILHRIIKYYNDGIIEEKKAIYGIIELLEE
jgi:hypothetical protein